MTDHHAVGIHPTAHIPDLFRRALKTATVKGDVAMGGPSPLLPWLKVTSQGLYEDESVPDTNKVEQPRKLVCEEFLPTWLQLSLESTVAGNPSATYTFALKPISQVGFGFGHSRPW